MEPWKFRLVRSDLSPLLRSFDAGFPFILMTSPRAQGLVGLRVLNDLFTLIFMFICIFMYIIIDVVVIII